MTGDQLTASPLPPLRVEPDAPRRVRAAHAVTGRRIVVLDDDPTGSQTVHGIQVVTRPDAGRIEAALCAPGSTCFVLTNTRSLSEADAVELNARLGRSLLQLEQRLGAPVEVVSRSDSTLRGHFTAEVEALDAARRETTGAGYDGVLLVPSYFEAGRFTAGDVHYARAGDRDVPVGETEFARDATFGYAASNLRDFVAEKSGGTIGSAEVHGIGLEDIRLGGPERVAEILREVTDGAFVVVNATDYADLEVVVLGVLAAEAEGHAFLHRTGPSFVRALAGLEAQKPLTPADLWPQGHPGGHGLVVVGSHVRLSSSQVSVARAGGDLEEIELDVGSVADPARRDAHVADVGSRVVSALAGADVLLVTSRTLTRAKDPDASLRISRAVSAAVVDVVRAARAARPAWVVAKGGITSHDVAVHGLGIGRAEVLGQLLPGLVSVFRPIEAPEEVIGVPYVVFAGNVGDENTLAYIAGLFREDG
jgi:uncharacterized protein YgbK (DUF1537 family)